MAFSLSGILSSLATGGVVAGAGTIAPEAAILYGAGSLIDTLLTGQSPIGQLESALGLKHGLLGSKKKTRRSHGKRRHKRKRSS